MDRQQFEQWIHERFIDVTPLQIAQFNQYLDLLIEWNAKINLMSRAEGLDIYEKHFIDSLLFDIPDDVKGKAIIDLGAGAGFPGIPLKIMHPETPMYLLEPTKKRADFLQLVVQTLNLSKIEVINARAEEYAADAREMFDVLVARAVAPLNILLELASPLVKPGGLVIAFKGERASQELIEAETAIHTLKLTLKHEMNRRLPTLDHARTLLVFEKTETLPSRYPRPYANIKKQPL